MRLIGGVKIKLFWKVVTLESAQDQFYSIVIQKLEIFIQTILSMNHLIMSSFQKETVFDFDLDL